MYRLLASANSKRLVLGCIDSYDSDQRFSSIFFVILQHFSRSTRFTFLCTAPYSKIVDFFFNFLIFFVKLNFGILPIGVEIARFRSDFDEFFSEFHEMF